MSNKKAIVSSIWKNPRCRRGLAFAATGILLFFLGGGDLLEDPADQFALWGLYVGCLLFLAGATLALIAWRREMRIHALSSATPVSRGRVLSVKKDWLSQAYVLHYRFNDSIGRIYCGKKILSQQEAFTWREGEEGEVRYDSTQPNSSVWIGRAVEFDAEDSSATAPATIIEVAEHDDDGDKKPLVRYRYRDHLGDTHEDRFIEDEGASYKVGEAGVVEFDLRHSGLNQWLGKTDAVFAPDNIAQPRFPAKGAVMPSLGRASRPSAFRLARRSKPLINAVLLLFYIFIVVCFLLMLVAVAEAPASRDDMLGVTLLSVALLALIVWFALSVRKGAREVKDWWHIVSRGSASVGTVNLVEERRQNLGRWTWKPGWVVSYRYRDHEGKLHSGESGYLSRREVRQWRSRDQCAIIYDPVQSSRSVWIGKP